MEKEIVYVQPQQKSSSLLGNVMTLGAIGLGGYLALDLIADGEIDGKFEFDSDKTSEPDTVPPIVALDEPRELTSLQIYSLLTNDGTDDNGNNIPDAIDGLIEETFGGTVDGNFSIENFLKEIEIRAYGEENGDYTVSIFSSNTNGDDIYAPQDADEFYDPNNSIELLRWHTNQAEIDLLETITGIDFDDLTYTPPVELAE